jgi:hypothetical protein
MKTGHYYQTYLVEFELLVLHALRNAPPEMGLHGENRL